MAAIRRKAHVYRIYQCDDDGNVLDEDVWVDVMRIDVFKVTLHGYTDVDGQEIVYYTDWKDDTTAAVKERIYDRLTVENAEDLESDPPQSLVVPIIHRTRFVFPSTQKGDAYQEVKYSFRNEPKDKSNASKRKFRSIRVCNNDLNDKITFPEVEAGKPQPATTVTGSGLGRVKYPVTWDQYAAALQEGEKDTDQYIDVEVCDDFRVKYPNSSYSGGSGAGQVVLFHLENRKSDPVGVETLFDAPPSDAKLDPYRLDPLQVIVNVSWRNIAVEFFDKDG